MNRAMRVWVIVIGTVLILLTGDAAAVFSTQIPPTPAAPAPAGQALLNQYCITCHNQQANTGGLALDKMDFEQVGKDAAVWEKAVRKIRTGMMPPSGARRPERAALDAFAFE